MHSVQKEKLKDGDLVAYYPKPSDQTATAFQFHLILHGTYYDSACQGATRCNCVSLKFGAIGKGSAYFCTKIFYSICELEI